jgi:hypothetical protein
MAENIVNFGDQGDTENESLPEWKERIEMTRLAWRHILDPILTFSELIKGYDSRGRIDLTLEEVSDVLRLLVLGGYTESKMHCTIGDSLCHTCGDALEKELENWDGSRKDGK